MATTLSERILQVLAETGLSTAELSRSAGVSRAAVTHWKTGDTASIGAKAAANIERLHGYSSVWLVSGKGPTKRLPTTNLDSVHPSLGYAGRIATRTIVPVVGTARMGVDGFYEELGYPVGHGDGSVEAATSDAGAYALRVRGDSMSPAIEDGYFVVVEPGSRCVAGEKVIIKTRDGRSMCKKLLYTRHDTLTVQSVNGGAVQTLEQSEIEFCHPVAAIISPSKWRPE